MYDEFNFTDTYIVSFTKLNEEQKKEVLEWRNDKLVRKSMYNDKIIDLKEHLNFIGNLRKDYRNKYWLVIYKEEKIGVIYLNNIDLMNKRAYLGVYSNLKSQKKSKGQILMNCLHQIAFKKLKLHSLKLEVLNNNPYALNLYKKAGYTQEGILRDYILRSGKYIDVIIMGIIDEEVFKNK